MTRTHRRTSTLSLALLVLLALVGLAFGLQRPAHAASGHTIAAVQLQGQLNMNTATEQQWQLLPGIGPATAAKIVAYRQRRPFRSLPQLMRIKGIGRKTFARIRPYLSLTGETTLEPG
jgi:competence protein ComEA